MHNRRRFLQLTLASAGSTAGFSLPAWAFSFSNPLETVRSTIGSYGTVMQLQQEGLRATCEVRIDTMQNFFEACQRFCRLGPVQVDGNKLQLIAGSHRIQIVHRV